MARCKSVLLMDGESQGRERLAQMLEMLGYETHVAESGPEGLDRLDPEYDLVILDSALPEIDGFEMCGRLRQDPLYSQLPILMLTENDSDRLRAIDAGADDFVSKPINLTELRARTGSMMRLKEAQEEARQGQVELERRVIARTEEVHTALYTLASAHRKTDMAYLETIERFTIAAEYRDGDTAEHIRRVSRYCEIIARSIGLPEDEIGVLGRASMLHDIGMIGISDGILLKPGSLTAEERKTMEQHTVIGADILSGSNSPVLKAGEVMALSHHERWDGTGYPFGLERESIPLYGRICAVADVFDAVTSTRPYKRALSCDDACLCLLEGRGTQFDPTILDRFFESMEAVMEVQGKLGEPAAEMFLRKAA